MYWAGRQLRLVGQRLAMFRDLWKYFVGRWEQKGKYWCPGPTCATSQGLFLGFPDGSDGKESSCNAGDLGSIPGLGRCTRGGHGNPCQYSCLATHASILAWRISIDRGAWLAVVHMVAKSWT